ncbi:MAG: AAA family ATPase [Woeseiaceae bacterium]|nr:AAA family ATPase [Woeseiaceae bacterium]
MHRTTDISKSVDSSLIQLLRQPGAYPHPVTAVEVIETHISWVLLAGDFAYKIKKPLDLGFLNFIDLQRRRFYCEEEIRLNKPWAPSVYLAVVPIMMCGDKAKIDGSGSVVEYAVKMRRFDPAKCLDVELATGNLSVADMLEVAAMLAKRHHTTPVITAKLRTQTVSRAIDLIRENFEPLDGVIEKPLFDELYRWTIKQLEELTPYFWKRFDGGFFRECHGDLHLANIVRLPDGITTFDCIEFSDSLRNTDVMADIAFLIMDLVDKQRLDLAAHCINRYLEITGDYDGMRVFNLYYTYRCLVRAKVAVIRAEERKDSDDRRRNLEDAHRHCKMARRQIRSQTPLLMVMTGLSGSGKTWVSGQLMAALPAIRIRSDIERKRLFGLNETASSNSGLNTGIYNDAVSKDLYSLLNTLATALLQAGHNVVLDASFLRVEQRASAHAAAKCCQARFVLLQTVADEALLQTRIRARKNRHDDASEADATVLPQQLRNAEALTAEEQSWTVSCNTEEVDVSRLVENIHRKTGPGRLAPSVPMAGTLAARI